jgi:hypothetical protein
MKAITLTTTEVRPGIAVGLAEQPYTYEVIGAEIVLGQEGEGARKVCVPLPISARVRWRQTERRAAAVEYVGENRFVRDVPLEYGHVRNIWEPCGQKWFPRILYEVQLLALPGEDAEALMVRLPNMSPDGGSWSYKISPDNRAEVLAEGLFARHPAGHYGCGADVLLVLKPGAALRIDRVGRLERGEARHASVSWGGSFLFAERSNVVDALKTYGSRVFALPIDPPPPRSDEKEGTVNELLVSHARDLSEARTELFGMLAQIRRGRAEEANGTTHC